jgi:predicted RNA-binding protein with PUA-like domain
MKYWLIKSEEDTYSIDDMARDITIDWFGIRNYQARNFMRDGMKLGDLALFYHSNAKPSGVHGVVQVTSLPHSDEKAFDSNHMYFDKRSTKEKPLWVCVDFTFVENLKDLYHFLNYKMIVN